MKRWTCLLVVAAVFTVLPESRATVVVQSLEKLTIDIWPDYDRPSVLVLLTGTLAQETPLPARIILPLPASATLNAIARIDSRDGMMKDDVLSSPGDGKVSFITPNRQFRMEYYYPYHAKDKRHSFDYTWLAEIGVRNLRLKVQQPQAAVNLRTVPGTIDIALSADELVYYTFPERPVAAGQRYSVRVEYTMPNAVLSVARQPVKKSISPAPAASSPSKRGAVITWPGVMIGAGAVLTILALLWLIISRRRSVST